MSLQEQAQAAWSAKVAHDSADKIIAQEKRFARDRALLEARMHELLGIAIDINTVERSEKGEVSVEVDGLRFLYRHDSEWRQFRFNRPCGCSTAVTNLAGLGRELSPDSTHKCPVKFEPAEQTPPAPTTEEAFMEALRNLIYEYGQR